MAFSYDVAVDIAKEVANGERDVVRVPDDTIIVMDDSARLLPVTGRTIPLAQYTNVERLA